MISDKQFDELLHIIIPETCNEEIFDIEDQISVGDKHIFSKSFEEKMLFIFKGKKKIENEIDPLKIRAKPKIKYVLVAILLFVLSSMTVLAYEPARIALEKIIFSVFDDSLLFRPDMEKTEENEGDIIFLKPTYIPESYYLMEEYISPAKTNITLVWIDENENTLFYEQRIAQGGDLRLSSDGAIPIDIDIGGKNGKLIVENDGTKTIFYEEGDSIFIITGVINEDEMINILMNLENLEE